jgi:hypothetical protein
MAQTAHSFSTGADLFPALPPGFHYRDAPIAPDGERALAAYLLRGPARGDWEHSVPPVEARRYSITFRNFIPDFALPP